VDEAILFQRLMQDWLSSFVKLLTTDLGAHIGDLAGDLLAAESSFFQLVRDLQIRERFVKVISPD